MSRPRWSVTLLVVLSAFGVACGSDDDPSSSGARGEGAGSFRGGYQDASHYPVFASSELVVGENRFLVGLLDDQDAPVADPSIDMHITFFDLDGSTAEPRSDTDMRFIWIQKPYQGIYVGRARFDAPGEWGAEVTLSGGGVAETVRGTFEVQRRSSTPEIGAPAPAVDTPTAAEVGGKLAKISTDPHPTARFYRLSVKDALRRGKPFVVIFATPKFCTSQTCGPTVQIAEQVARRFPRMTFIHVEPYELPADPSNLKPVSSVGAWGLPTEPWVFVVDQSGDVAAKFEGAISAPELSAALRSL